MKFSSIIATYNRRDALEKDRPDEILIADHRALAERGFWVQGRRCFAREPFVAAFVPGKTAVWQWALRGRVSRPHKSFRLPFPLIFRNKKQRGIIGCNR